MANGHTADELAEMVVGDIESIAVYHMTHNPVSNSGE